MPKPIPQEQIIELTGKRRPSAQAKALRHMGIDFRIRPDGMIVIIDTDLPINGTTKPDAEGLINWEAI